MKFVVTEFKSISEYEIIKKYIYSQELTAEYTREYEAVIIDIIMTGINSQKMSHFIGLAFDQSFIS
jgi:hypothetical protein